MPQGEPEQPPRTREAHVHSDAYAELKLQVRQHGFLEKQTRYYTGKIVITLALFVLTLGLLPWLHTLWLQSLDAVVLALLTTQMGFLGHDAGHRQICHHLRWNDLVGLLAGNVILGMSFGWWLEKHNQHHSHPNQLDTDPDISIPFLAFSETDAERKHGFARFMVCHQAWCFFPLLCVESVALQVQGVSFLLGGRARHTVTEMSLLVLHYCWYIGVLFLLLSPWEALLFLVIHQGVTGLYLGSTFAPNHKGMPILDGKTPLDFLHRQVITARNVRGHPLIDCWYGGLNYQIEHHLFPTMPRNQLKRAQPLVRQFCKERSIPYYETSMAASYGEIIAYLHRVGRSSSTLATPA
jgi:fatty acid desaturase